MHPTFAKLAENETTNYTIVINAFDEEKITVSKGSRNDHCIMFLTKLNH